MNTDILQRRHLPSPPPGFGEAFWNWLRVASRELDVALFDDHPMPAEDLDALEQQLGLAPRELTEFYSQSTPWGDQRPGPQIWKGHLELVRERAIANYALAQDPRPVEELRALLAAAPPLWPVYVSQKANIAAFTDQRGRVGVINVGIGANLGSPLASSVRNFVVMTVVGEAVWEEKNYRTYDEVLLDEAVGAAGAWWSTDRPEHPLIALYEALKRRRLP
jgi:hypothetical protein